jgi:hypothetical protein
MARSAREEGGRLRAKDRKGGVLGGDVELRKKGHVTGYARADEISE